MDPPYFLILRYPANTPMTCTRSYTTGMTPMDAINVYKLFFPVTPIMSSIKCHCPVDLSQFGVRVRLIAPESLHRSSPAIEKKF
jgi:hypothetical protein